MNKEITTIQLLKNTRERLANAAIGRETYDEIINRLLDNEGKTHE